MYPHALKKALERVGLLRPAFRLNEWLRVLGRHGQGRQEDVELLADGLPIPPPRYLVAIGSVANAAAYLAGGRATADLIERMLVAQHARIGEFDAILDFGCGSGRIIRNFRQYTPPVRLEGTDYNPRLVQWCQEHLPFARFQTNSLAPPLRYADESFDLVYAFSVFTHLSAPLQLAWCRELHRIVRAGGFLIFTVHPENAAEQLSESERASYAAGDLVVRYASVSGSNLTAAFHPEQYIRTRMAPGWRVLDIHHSSSLLQRFVMFQKGERPSALQ